MSLRREVIGLYRQVFRVARNWQALNPNNTAAEKEYIQNEARSLFRQNKQVNLPIIVIYKSKTELIVFSIHYFNCAGNGFSHY
jgi:hypothetical protein